MKVSVTLGGDTFIWEGYQESEWELGTAYYDKWLASREEAQQRRIDELTAKVKASTDSQEATVQEHQPK